MYIGHFEQLSEMLASLRRGESLKVKVCEKALFSLFSCGQKAKNLGPKYVTAKLMGKDLTQFVFNTVLSSSNYIIHFRTNKARICQNNRTLLPCTNHHTRVFFSSR